MEQIKRLPLGVSNFRYLREDNRYFVDNTQYIERLEKLSNFLFLVRPRRFGKSLFLSMLESYYDIDQKDDFDKLFGGLWIHEHPTDNRGKYLVMRYDFSQVRGNLEELPRAFNDYCEKVIGDFVSNYAHYFSDGFIDELKEEKDAFGKLGLVLFKCKRLCLPLYLIVDEYDNFTNVVLNSRGLADYEAITHGEGFFRDYFKLFKPNFERILMLGVSPVTMDDLTSGYNIATNITQDSTFNAIMGFSEPQGREMVEYYRRAGLVNMETEEIVADMKPWYDNYCFSKDSLDDARVFNSDMVLYYLSNVIEKGTAPESYLDENARMDYGKIRKLISYDKLDMRRKGLLLQIAKDGYINGRLVRQFPAHEVIDESNFVSLLYYYGMLTIGGTRGAMLKLTIPNNNARELYYEYILREYNKEGVVDMFRLDELAYQMAYAGDWRPMFEFIAGRYSEDSSVRSGIEGERNYQGYMAAYMGQLSYYLVCPEMELNHGYADFFLMPDKIRYKDVSHSYIVELKYLSKADYKNGETAKKQWDEAVGQIREYAKAKRVGVMKQGTELHCIVIQMSGDEIGRMEEIDVQ